MIRTFLSLLISLVVFCGERTILPRLGGCSRRRTRLGFGGLGTLMR
jgi:hypothetical protein